ncbi:hypothetical protein JC525_04100 [Alteromonas sp. IB21]|nr:hypothetical protein [Alteromonas sp. IB21]
MNNSNLQHLHALCLQMHNEGKTPTVGILRAKAPFKVSVTEAIEAIKRFNANKPALDRHEGSASAPPHPELPPSRSDHLYERIENLEKEVDELKRVLQQLVNEKR